MARSRRGSFGLQPRVAPNVAGQIIALAREYVAKRDQMIMDAWRNGGTFEGKQVTDDMALDYWQERYKDLDPADPQYESAKNQVMQLEYAIAQSKADVLHVQGKMSTMAYAQFFLNWAKKVPKNSEFYRTLQKDAAQLIESAKAKARADGERARVEAFNNFVKTTTERDIAIGDALTKALTSLSQSTGLSITGNGDELLALLTQDVKTNPQEYRQLTDAIKKGDPDWDGQLTAGYFSQHIKQATAGYEKIADRAQQAGYVSAYANATEGMATMSNWGQNTKVWAPAQTYNDVMNAFYKVANDPTASQMDVMAAAQAASTKLSELGKTPGIDAASKTMIDADAMRLLGQDAGDDPSFGQAMLGRNGVTPELTMTLGAWTATAEQMKANPTAWAYAPVDKNGQFDPTGQGSLGMVPAGSVPPGAQAVLIPGRDGKAVMAMVQPHSVYTTDPNNPNGSPQLAGYQISYNVGGRKIEMWGYQDDKGQNHWSLVSPLAEGAATMTDNKGDIYVTAPPSAASDPIAKAKEIDAKLGTNIAGQLEAQKAAGASLGDVKVTTNQLDANGKNVGSVELTYSNGTFTATQKQNTLDKDGKVVATQSTPIDIGVGSPRTNAFSASRLSAGEVPGVTFSSPMGASVKASGYTQTQDQISMYASDPAFQQAFLSQVMQTLGTDNPWDPRIADAWKDVTTATSATRPPTGGARRPSDRDDLTYPGGQASNPAAFGSKLTVNFGKDQLVVPGLPSYLQNPNVDLTKFGQLAGTISDFAKTLIPGLGAASKPGQTAQGTPAPVVTPTPTPTPTATNPTPTPMPTGLPAPAPTSAPVPSPTPYQPNDPRYRRLL